MTRDTTFTRQYKNNSCLNGFTTKTIRQYKITTVSPFQNYIKITKQTYTRIKCRGIIFKSSSFYLYKNLCVHIFAEKKIQKYKITNVENKLQNNKCNSGGIQK